MAKMKKRSVAPVYAAALVWLIFALFYDLYAVSHYITAAIISLSVFVLASGIFPSKEYELPSEQAQASKASSEPVAETPQVDPAVQALIAERDRAVGEMRRLNDTIKDPSISSQIDRLEVLVAKIIDHVVAHPEKQPQIRTFLNYYLPTTIKLLNSYDRMGSTGVSGENIDNTMQRIEGILDTIVQSFEKQLDSLFSNEAMDISSDITVMENLLAREGISGPQMET